MKRKLLPLIALILLFACLPGGLLAEQEEAPSAPSPLPQATTNTPIEQAIIEEATPAAQALEEPSPIAVTVFPQFPLQFTSTAEPIRPYAAGTRLSIDFITMITRQAGWALAGDHVLRTSDGGQIWEDVTPLQPSMREIEVDQEAVGFFLDPEHAWVLFVPQLGYAPEFSEIWSTQDGGISWQASQILLSQSGDYYDPSLLFLSATRGWFLGEVSWVGAGTHFDYLLVHTDDGGATWEGNRPAPGCTYTGMDFIDENTGWMTRACLGPYGPYVIPDLLITRDGGLTWDEVDLPPPADNPGLFDDYEYCATFQPTLFDPAAGRVAMECFGYDYQQSPGVSFLYASDDGGATWQVNPLPNPMRTTRIRVEGGDGGTLSIGPLPRSQLVWFDPAEGLHLGQKSYRTEDGGLSWEYVHEVIWLGQFSFVDPQYGWAVARTGAESALVVTTNGGQSWDILEPQIGP